MTTPKAGVAYTFSISLFDVANPGRLKLTPTIATGDFKVSINGGALANLASLPVETPVNSGIVVVSLAGAEVGTKTVVRWLDPGFEWSDGSYFFDAPAYTIDDAARTKQMTEAYAANGVAPTLEEALFMLMQGFLEFTITGTSITTRKIDRSTTAMIHTLNDAVNPTSRTRTT